jgi:hypothetical protein
MWWKAGGLAMGFLASVITTVFLYGAYSWQSDTEKLYAQLDALSLPITPKLYDPSELDELPPPVQRYFHAVLQEGQPIIAAVRVVHTGTFNLNTTEEQWTSFGSTQRVVTQRPGFVWDASMSMAPVMSVNVYDAYVAGRGVLTARLLGFFTVMEQPSTPELAQGELMRFLAEAVWYPTALLPSQGVHWEAVDDAHAVALLTDDTTTVELVFEFDSRGLVSSVHSDVRYREVDGVQVPTPWRGRFWNYQPRDGMLVPVEGEVAWLLQEGMKPYWRGHIRSIKYEFAQ